MLTEKQQRVLDVITDFTTQNGKSPTIEELKNILEQKSKRWVTQYLEVLEKKWFLTRWNGYRWIRLWNAVGFQTTLNIPILGYANAGTPLAVAEQNDYGTLPISKNIISGNMENYFVLKVEWTSMNNHLVNNKVIDNGSYVLIKKDEKNLNSRDPYLFVVNGWATIKIFRKEWESVYLIPDSKDDSHKPIILSEYDDVQPNGKVVDVFNFG